MRVPCSRAVGRQLVVRQNAVKKSIPATGCAVRKYYSSILPCTSTTGPLSLVWGSKITTRRTDLQKQESLVTQRRLLSTDDPSSLLLTTESEFHDVADETLEGLQDAVEQALEENGIQEQFEINLASGVLTLSLPPHGTWVINKQTPNRQLWWSSPISGPRRYEYEGNQEWVYTRDESHSVTLFQTLQEEVRDIYQVEIEDL